MTVNFCFLFLVIIMMGIEKGHEYGMSEEDFSGKGYKIDIKNCPRIPIFTHPSFIVYIGEGQDMQQTTSPFKQEHDEDSSGLRSVSYSHSTYSSVLLPTVDHRNFGKDYSGQLALLNLLYNKLGIEHRPMDANSYRHELFLAFDVNRSGYITRGEFNNVLIEKFSIYLAKEQMDWLVSHFDLDHDGKINYEEFLLLLQKLRSAEVEQDSSGSLTEKKKHSTPTRSRREKAITTPTKQNTGLLWDYGSDRYNTHSPTKEEKISKKIAIIKEFNAKQYEEFLRKDEEAHNQYMNTHHHNELQRQREDYQLIENLNIHSEDPSLLLQRFVKEINGQCENGQSTLRNLFKKWDRDHDNVWGKEDVRYALEATLGADVLSRMSSDLFNSFYGTLDIKNDGKVKFFELVNILGSINCEEDHEHIYTDEGNQKAHRNEHLDSKRHEGVHNQDIVPPSTPSRLQTLSSNKISPGTRKVYEDVHFSPSRGVQDDMKNYQEIERLENKLNNEIDKMNKLKSPLRVIPDSIRSPGGSRLPSSSIHIRTSPSSDRKKTEEWNSINGANSSSSSKFTLSKENLKVDGSHSVADIMTDKAIRATADRIGEALHMEHIPAFKFFSNTLHLNLHEEISVDNFILAMSKINILLTKDQAASLMLVARKLSEIDSKDGSTGNREVDSLSEHFGSLYINKQYNITITAKDFVKFLSYI